jgi:uncharacterized protein DUF4240
MAKAKTTTKAKPTATTKAKPKAPAKAASKASPKDDDRWWELIERAGEGVENPDEQAEQLHDLLVDELNADEILEFDTFVHEKLRDAYRNDLWEVAYVMNGGCSDDGFDYFCGWLVGMGKAHYEAALKNPEDAAKGVEPGNDPYENEGFWYVAANAWQEKTGKDDVAYEAAATHVTRELIGEGFDEDELMKKFPKLAKKFGS